MEQIAGIDPEFWTVLDRVVQWLIIPALVAAWYLNRRVDSQEREILRILTILEERNQRRDEDRKVDHDRLERIERDIHDMRNLIFAAFQRKNGD